MHAHVVHPITFVDSDSNRAGMLGCMCTQCCAVLRVFERMLVWEASELAMLAAFYP